MPVQCKWCSSTEHTQFFCRMKKRKPIKQKGQKTLDYEKFRDTVARPFLDDYFGHKCVVCGATEDLDIDHIKSRGARPDLKFELTNLQYLCRTCHRRKTDGR